MCACSAPAVLGGAGKGWFRAWKTKFLTVRADKWTFGVLVLLLLWVEWAALNHHWPKDHKIYKAPICAKITPFSWLRKMHPKRFPGCASRRWIVPVFEVFGCVCVWEQSVNDAHPKIQQLQWEKRGKNLGGGFEDNEMSVTISEVIAGRMDRWKKVISGNKGSHHTPLPKLLLQCPKTWNHSEHDTICASQMQFAVFFLLFMDLFLLSCLL